MFKMKSYESIGDMFTRFNEITNSLQSLGKCYSQSDLVRKVLRSLTPDWRKKTTTIEEVKDLCTYFLESLIRNLTSYEAQMKEKELDDAPKKKCMAFKASIESDDLDVEDDLALISHKFKKFLKEGRSQKKWHRSSNKKDKRKIKKKKVLQAT